MAARPLVLPAQRAAGRLTLAFRHDGAGTRLRTLGQEGCLKARLPRPAEKTLPEAIAINLSGGIAGGDTLRTDVTLGDNARLMFTTQAAERLYRALDEPARITTRLSIGPGAALDYLPQETIVFDGFSLDRALEIELAERGRFLGVEAILFGRLAMGETLRRGSLRDRISIRRGGKLVLQDMTRLNGGIAAALGRPGVGGGAMAVATLVYAAPDAAALLPGLRDVIAPYGGASLVEDIIFARLLAPDGFSLRNCLMSALTRLRAGRPLPRTWQG